MKCWQALHTQTTAARIMHLTHATKGCAHFKSQHTHAQVTSRVLVQPEQSEYFGFSVKQADSRSVVLCKRCSNSIRAYMKDNMAEENSPSDTLVHTPAQVTLLWTILLHLKLLLSMWIHPLLSYRCQWFMSGYCKYYGQTDCIGWRTGVFHQNSSFFFYFLNKLMTHKLMTHELIE